MDYPELRSELIATCRRMNALGLNQGRAGNASVRVPGGMLITPTGMAYDALGPADIVALADDGSLAPGQRRPSSEWPLHLAILRARPEVGAVIHTHAMFCTTLACLGLEIPAFHYMVAVAGGDSIRCAPYATFGSAELAARALAALQERTACLLANHGMVAVAPDLAQALELAQEVETLAAMYWRALAVGRPRLLSAVEMARVVEKFKTYGQQPESAAATADSQPQETM
ncbi:MAG TPA: class II aldolase/adducin family protein [Candidatus Competibacteraceae bacterium]|nr:class II aldolase/adducin family protein [Candidatus Competibacteraceae bacterium]